jgi:multiple antibiotic resistance protein
MDRFSFVFTILFMLLGPLKIIHPFAGLTHGTDLRFKRAVAVRGALIATALCFFVALAGAALLGKYRIQVDAVRIAGGLVLLLAALKGIFTKPAPPTPLSGSVTPGQLAFSPVAVPIIVPHAGVAALLIFVLHEPLFPGMTQLVLISLAVLMALDFLVMYFIEPIVKFPGVMLVLGVLGAVLVFVQACLATQMILVGLKLLSPVMF